MASLELRGGTTAMPSAHVVLSDGDGKVEADGEGNGMIDAAFDAIAGATGVESAVLDFKVSSVTKGGDALGDVVDPARVRRREGVGPRCRHRRGRGVGACVPRRGQQDRAAARAARPPRGHRRRSLIDAGVDRAGLVEMARRGRAANR